MLKLTGRALPTSNDQSCSALLTSLVLVIDTLATDRLEVVAAVQAVVAVQVVVADRLVRLGQVALVVEHLVRAVAEVEAAAGAVVAEEGAVVHRRPVAALALVVQLQPAAEVAVQPLQARRSLAQQRQQWRSVS